MSPREHSKDLVEHIDLWGLIGELVMKKPVDGVVNVRLSVDEVAFFVAMIEEQYREKRQEDEASHTGNQMTVCGDNMREEERRQLKDGF